MEWDEGDQTAIPHVGDFQFDDVAQGMDPGERRCTRGGDDRGFV